METFVQEQKSLRKEFSQQLMRQFSICLFWRKRMHTIYYGMMLSTIYYFGGWELCNQVANNQRREEVHPNTQGLQKGRKARGSPV